MFIEQLTIAFNPDVKGIIVNSRARWKNLSGRKVLFQVIETGQLPRFVILISRSESNYQ